MTTLKRVEARIRDTAVTASDGIPTAKEALRLLNRQLNQNGFNVNGEVVKERGYNMVSCLFTPAFASAGRGAPVEPKTTATQFRDAAAAAGFGYPRTIDPDGNQFSLEVIGGNLQVVHRVSGGGYTFFVTPA